MEWERRYICLYIFLKKFVTHYLFLAFFTQSHVKVTAIKQFNFPPSVQFHLKVNFRIINSLCVRMGGIVFGFVSVFVLGMFLLLFWVIVVFLKEESSFIIFCIPVQLGGFCPEPVFRFLQAAYKWMWWSMCGYWQ